MRRNSHSLEEVWKLINHEIMPLWKREKETDTKQYFWWSWWIGYRKFQTGWGSFFLYTFCGMPKGSSAPAARFVSSPYNQRRRNKTTCAQWQ
jgi:hypothetical protein